MWLLDQDLLCHTLVTQTEAANDSASSLFFMSSNAVKELTKSIIRYTKPKQDAEVEICYAKSDQLLGWED